MIRKPGFILLLVLLCCPAEGAVKNLLKKKDPPPSPLDEYVRQAEIRQPEPVRSPGSLLGPGRSFTDLASDPKASHVDDIVTIVVAERASAISQGGTTTQRKSSASSSVTSLAGATKAAGALANLAGLGGESKLTSDGTTSRTTILTTTLSARVTHVLPNGNMVLEGSKQIVVNSERQTVTVKGVVRPADLSSDNSVRSDRLAMMEVLLNGNGVVADSIRRPMFLYRLLLGLLPF